MCTLIPNGTMSDHVTQNERDNLIGLLCYEIAMISKQYLSEMFKKSAINISSEQAWILSKAYEYVETGVPQSQLVTKHQLIGGKSQVSRQIQDLVEKGFINRRVDENDRRQVYICLTQNGLELYKRISEIIHLRKSMYLDSLNEEEYEHLVKLLNKYLSSLRIQS